MKEIKNKNKKHWLVLWVCCGLSMASIGLGINTVGVFYTPVSNSLGVLRGTFAAHATIALFAASFMSFWVPMLMKRFSYKSILVVSVLIASGSTVLMGFSTHVFMFFLLGGLRGASSALFAIVPLTMIMNEWFEKKHGLATSIVLGLSGMGGALFSPILANFIESHGWEVAYVMKGFFFLLLCLPAIIYPFSLTPQEDGLLPYGAEEGELKKEVTPTEKIEFNFLQVGFICFLGFSTLMAGLTAIGHHLPGFAESLGYSTSTGAALLSAAMIGNILFKLLIGVLSDQIGAIKASILMVMTNIIGLLILVMVPNTWMLVLGSFLFGALFSVGSVGAALLTKQFFGLDKYTKIYPLVSFVGGLGVAFSLSAVGFIYDFTGSYLMTFMIAFITHGISMVLLFWTVIKTRPSLELNKSIKGIVH